MGQSPHTARWPCVCPDRPVGPTAGPRHCPLRAYSLTGPPGRASRGLPPDPPGHVPTGDSTPSDWDGVSSSRQAHQPSPGSPACQPPVPFHGHMNQSVKAISPPPLSPSVSPRLLLSLCLSGEPLFTRHPKPEISYLVGCYCLIQEGRTRFVWWRGGGREPGDLNAYLSNFPLVWTVSVMLLKQ